MTDTYDAAGEVVEASGQRRRARRLEAALQRFRGTFEQTPPAYSAKMVEGERSYVRARARQAGAVAAGGRDGARTRPARSTRRRSRRVRVRCSAGFYVRSLAHDLGAAAGTGAHSRGAGADRSRRVRHSRTRCRSSALVTAPRADLRRAGAADGVAARPTPDRGADPRRASIGRCTAATSAPAVAGPRSLRSRRWFG